MYGRVHPRIWVHGRGHPRIWVHGRGHSHLRIWLHRRIAIALLTMIALCLSWFEPWGVIVVDGPASRCALLRSGLHGSAFREGWSLSGFSSQHSSFQSMLWVDETRLLAPKEWQACYTFNFKRGVTRLRATGTNKTLPDRRASRRDAT